MKKGDEYKGFRVERDTQIKEINVRVREIVHEKSGAKVIAVEADDEENLFAITLSTYPSDDSGVAHILEHSVLCGSENFPIHDPFFSMLKRSINTFMNALTSKLWTSYPAASKNRKDFYNLLDVYLDAVFKPKLTKECFLQEGHRLEFATPDDPTSELGIKGIVFNEMKGAYSIPYGIFWRKLMGGLCAGSTYGFDSGGDPEVIPDLTYEQLKAFHKEYYHPSRANYFFYGNIDIENHLDVLSEKVLNHTEKLNVIPPVEKQLRLTAPKRERAVYPAPEGDLSKQTFIGFSWLTADIKDQDDLLAISLIDSILMDTDASPLRHKLINSGYCIQADSSYDPDAREVPFAIICRGCNEEDADKLEEFLFKSLKEIVEEKIPAELLESSMHQLEFSRSEISSDHQPYPLEIFSRTVLPYLQGGRLLEGLKIHSLFEKLAKLIIDEDYLPNIIQRYFLDNQHMYRLVMAPDREVLSKLQQTETKKLRDMAAAMTAEEKTKVVEQTRDLAQYREGISNEDNSCLPILPLGDIPTDAPYYPLEKVNVDCLTVYHHEAFTNEITYSDLVFDLPQIAEEDLPYIRLFASLLPDLGAGGRTYEQNLHYIQQHLGGISTSLSLNVQRTNPHTCYPTISLSAKSLTRKNEEMFGILRDFILTPDLKDTKRIKELILQTYESLQSHLNNSAAMYALKESAAGFSPWNHVNNLWHGYPYFQFIEKIAKNIDTELPIVLEKFEQLARSVFHLNNPHLITTCDQKTYEVLESTGFYGLSKCSEASAGYQPWVELASTKTVASSIRFLSTQTATNVHSIPTVTITSIHAPALKIATHLFENLEIHTRVREIGGAYSTGVLYNILIGNFQFYSSQDPNVCSTYTAFLTAVDRIAEGLFSEQDLHEAKLGYIQDVDGVVPPSARGPVTYYQHKVGLTLPVRQEFRERLLTTTREEIVVAVNECILKNIKDHSVRVTYANQDIYDREQPLFKQSSIPELKISKDL